MKNYRFTWPVNTGQSDRVQHRLEEVPKGASNNYHEAFSVQQFCDAHGIGRNLFYRMLAEGTGPSIMKIGRRTLISRESAAAWRRKIEQQTSEKLAERAAHTTGWIVGGRT